MRQRRELTFKHNQSLGRHGWLRLTPAYSVKLVDDILAEERCRRAVLDPFSGSGTTALAAVSRGKPALATDINPFLVWLARAKTRRYRAAEIERAGALGEQILERAARASAPRAEPPPIKDVERWWSPRALATLCALRRAIDDARPRKPERELLEIAFCRTLIGVSNAAFNHQSMSFQTARGARPRARRVDAALFVRELAAVLDSAREAPAATAEIELDDARVLDSVARRSFDLVVTSPPYPNRMSYVRELRPYMYWLGYLKQAREAGELDWRAIGGTWGVATSRLGDWRSERKLWPSLARVTAKIAASGAPNAELLSKYVAKYFVDARAHLTVVASKIERGGRVHYVVGNSTFYGVLVPTERLYAELLRELGFERVEIVRLRKRNSKRELYEFDVRGVRN